MIGILRRTERDLVRSMCVVKLVDMKLTIDPMMMLVLEKNNRSAIKN